MWQRSTRRPAISALDLPREVEARVRAVGVSGDGRERRQLAQAREDRRVVDVAGVHDVRGAGEQLVQHGVVVAVRVAHDADEGVRAHGGILSCAARTAQDTRRSDDDGGDG